MHGTCSTHVKREKCVHNVFGSSLRNSLPERPTRRQYNIKFFRNEICEGIDWTQLA
jgi:hypothetical protein